MDEQQPETVENAKEMWDALGRRCPASMLELVMNHGSFAQTIENLFALSFLARCDLSRHGSPRLLTSAVVLPSSSTEACTWPARCPTSLGTHAKTQPPPLHACESNVQL